MIENPIGWALLSKPFEIVPFNDIHEHHGGEACACRPTINDEDVIVHNAWDQRETYIERGRKMH